MEIALSTNDNRLLKNKIFELDFDRDNILLIFRNLKIFLNNNGHNINTVDLVDLDKCDIILYFDLPMSDFYKNYRHKNNLIILENKYIWPINWEKRNHVYFKNILTWDYTIVDNIKYHNFFIPQELEIHKDFYNQKRKKFTLIASYKKNKHKNELYNLRKKVINIFECNNLEFDFYGFGWNSSISLNSFLMKIMNKLKLTNFIPVQKFNNYKGSILNKQDVLSSYDFCFCFENALEINGYISEKIFDCFRSGTIPIYMGDPNIKRVIPEDCYIFLNLKDDLLDIIKKINNFDQHAINNYRNSILKFLSSSNSNKFTFDSFNSQLYKIINNTL